MCVVEAITIKVVVLACAMVKVTFGCVGYGAEKREENSREAEQIPTRFLEFGKCYDWDLWQKVSNEIFLSLFSLTPSFPPLVPMFFRRLTCFFCVLIAAPPASATVSFNPPSCYSGIETWWRREKV